MPHYTDEQIEAARKMDLLTYLQTYEPNNLVKVCSNTYCTKEHDSLKISNGLWHWFSRNVGGKSALDYLMTVKGYSFQQGLETILGRAAVMSPVSLPKQKRKYEFELPQKYSNSDSVIKYLSSRGICLEVIRYCLRCGQLYEGVTEKNGRNFHNAVFVGFDEQGTARYAALRGLHSDFKGEAFGSDKRYSFSIFPANESSTLHLFESAIDLLSFATLEKLSGRSWRTAHLLSLAGVSKNGQELPISLQHYLDTHKEINSIELHLDNDEVGRAATENIRNALSENYEIADCIPLYGKDVNDELLGRIRIRANEYVR